MTVAVALMVTPSLAYMAAAISAMGGRAFGVAYGVYNVAWAVGLLTGPAIGGFAYERIGFTRLTLVWAAGACPRHLLVAWAGRRRARCPRCRIPDGGIP